MCCDHDSKPTLSNSTFIGNFAADYGSGIYNVSINTILTDCLVCGNFLSGPLAPSQIYGPFTDNGGNIINFACPPMEPLGDYLGDLDGDGDVDFDDFAIFANNWLAGIE